LFPFFKKAPIGAFFMKIAISIHHLRLWIVKTSQNRHNLRPNFDGEGWLCVPSLKCIVKTEVDP
jgi:hypothetical protein